MFRFSIRELSILTLIAVVSCVLALILGPADPFSQLLMAGFLFVFGGVCFAMGFTMGRKSKIPG